MAYGRSVLNNSLKICGMKVNLIQTSDVVKIMEDWIAKNNFGNYIVIANINDVVMSDRDNMVKEAVNSSSLSVPDGFSLVMLVRMRGYDLRNRVYGPDLMLEFLDISQNKGYSHFLYGATADTLDKFNLKLKQKFPQLKVAGSYSPPFRELSDKEDTEIVEIINNAAPDVLWVGLGCPKQQLWMYAHKDQLKVPVMVGVGAAFDFLSGVKHQAPKFMRDNGFEWLFRLATEPRRLWKRYLIGNAFFMKLILKNLFTKSTCEND